VLRWKQDTSSDYWPPDATAGTFVLLAALSRKDSVEVDAAFAQAFPDRSSNESFSAPSWRVRAAVNSAAAMVLAELPPAIRGPQVVRIAYYGSKRLSDEDPPASVDDSFFSLLSKAAAGIDTAEADRAFLACDAYSASLRQPSQPSLRQVCRSALAANASTTAADSFANRVMKDRKYSDYYGWLPVAAHVSSHVAAQLLQPFMRPSTYFPDAEGETVSLAFQVNESDARQFLQSGSAAPRDPAGLVSTLQLTIGERRSFLPILQVKAAGAERARLVSALLNANRTCCDADLGLPFAALSDYIPPGDIPRAFDAVERLLMNVMQQPVTPGPFYQVTSRAAVRAKLNRLVPVLRQWGTHLDRERRRTSLGTWIETLTGARPEDVNLYSPVLLGLVGPGDDRALLDLLKRPDSGAQAEVQKAAIEALQTLLKFEETGFWNAVGAAKAHGLDVVSAPSSDARHFLR